MSGEMTFDLVRELLGRMDGAEARFQAGRGLHESRVICREDAQDRFARQAIPLARLALSALARAEAAERRQEAALARVSELQRICIEQAREIEQTLGRALGFPENQTLPEIGGQPGDTSVQVFDHTAESLALTAAGELERLREALSSIGAAHVRGEIVSTNTPGFTALMEGRAALDRPAAAEAGAEAEGVEAGLGGAVGTHNPYLFRDGMEAQREAWERGNARVRSMVDAAYRRGADAATALAQAPDGCPSCRGKTFEDGMVCCWACGRTLPDAQAQAEGGSQ